MSEDILDAAIMPLPPVDICVTIKHRAVWSIPGLQAHYFISTLGKNLGPEKPCAATYSMSMFGPSLSCGLNSLSRMNLPALDLSQN